VPDDPLAAILDAAAEGRFPPVDGGCDLLAPDPSGTRAVVAFTGHAYVLADVDAAELVRRGADGFGGASHPELLQWLAGPDRCVGSLDAVLVAGGVAGPSLPRRHDLGSHPRVRRAARYRQDVEVYGDDIGMVVVGTGLAGRRELAIELFDPATAGRGHGRRLIRAGLARIGPGARCWAQVAPGNAASLRAFLAVGFVPVGSEVLVTPAAQ
jgi:hypothetical protein